MINVAIVNIRCLLRLVLKTLVIAGGVVSCFAAEPMLKATQTVLDVNKDGVTDILQVRYFLEDELKMMEVQFFRRGVREIAYYVDGKIQIIESFSDPSNTLKSVTYYAWDGSGDIAMVYVYSDEAKKLVAANKEMREAHKKSAREMSEFWEKFDSQIGSEKSLP